MGVGNFLLSISFGLFSLSLFQNRRKMGKGRAERKVARYFSFFSVPYHRHDLAFGFSKGRSLFYTCV